MGKAHVTLACANLDDGLQLPLLPHCSSAPSGSDHLSNEQCLAPASEPPGGSKPSMLTLEIHPLHFPEIWAANVSNF